MSENNMPKVTVSQSNLGTTLLLITFIVLKLTHIIDWSWWWVLSPFWIPLCLALVMFGIAGIIGVFTKDGYKG